MSEISIVFASPSGEEIRFDWPTDGLRELDPAVTDPRPWTLAGELDWDEVDAVRVVSGRFADGRALAIAAIRPAGASGHGEEAITGVLLDADDSIEQLDEVLLSTERGSHGELLRIGLELYPSDSGIALRIAGDTTERSTHKDGAITHEHAALALRATAGGGVGAFELLRRE